jgi:hypothetical protein
MAPITLVSVPFFTARSSFQGVDEFLGQTDVFYAFRLRGNPLDRLAYPVFIVSVIQK